MRHVDDIDDEHACIRQLDLSVWRAVLAIAEFFFVFLSFLATKKRAF